MNDDIIREKKEHVVEYMDMMDKSLEDIGIWEDRAGLTRLNVYNQFSAYRILVIMEYTMQKTSTDIENIVSNA